MAKKPPPPPQSDEDIFGMIFDLLFGLIEAVVMLPFQLVGALIGVALDSEDPRITTGKNRAAKNMTRNDRDRAVHEARLLKQAGNGRNPGLMDELNRIQRQHNNRSGNNNPPQQGWFW